MITKEELEGLFTELGELARVDGRIVEIAVYGGAALILSFPARPATKDVDAVFLDDPKWLRDAAATIYERHRAENDDIDANWLNDGVKGWLSSRDREEDVKSVFRTYPSEDAVGLRVMVARPDYLFAMKCIAMRIGGTEGKHDVGDIIRLARHLQIEDSDAALEAVGKYYPRNMIKPKTQFGIEEIFERIEADEDLRSGAKSPWEP